MRNAVLPAVAVLAFTGFGAGSAAAQAPLTPTLSLDTAFSPPSGVARDGSGGTSTDIPGGHCGRRRSHLRRRRVGQRRRDLRAACQRHARHRLLRRRPSDDLARHEPRRRRRRRRAARPARARARADDEPDEHERHRRRDHRPQPGRQLRQHLRWRRRARVVPGRPAPRHAEPDRGRRRRAARDRRLRRGRIEQGELVRRPARGRRRARQRVRRRRGCGSSTGAAAARTTARSTSRSARVAASSACCRWRRTRTRASTTSSWRCTASTPPAPTTRHFPRTATSSSRSGSPTRSPVRCSCTPGGSGSRVAPSPARTPTHSSRASGSTARACSRGASTCGATGSRPTTRW